MWQPLLISLIAAIILGFILIPLLRRFNFRQTVREDGPQSHLYKTGIPIMGGFIFIIPTFAVALLFTDDIKSTVITLAAITAFMFVGFFDDLLKIIRKKNEGLSVHQKTLALFIISSVFSVYTVFYTNIGSDMIIPFSAMGKVITVPFWIYIPFLIIFLYLITNSVNLTDGVDGLAGSVTSLVLLFFFMVVKAAPSGFENEEILILAAIGALIGFLLFNSYPAKVFMGDTGSMALGGLIGVLAIQMQMPWVILIAGLIYVVEALSSFIQVAHYKRKGERMFRMAPIHHHFELSGWKEQKVVFVFSLITIIACLLAYLVLGLF
ncbi:MAG: phospho-N-acetylmuramoyl-pentapeptide-transferase [Clostridiales bacterium]|nr:phospho-N-acetylmuramoyl-pentapeptide-transferase [Clostridiales bacterium]